MAKLVNRIRHVSGHDGSGYTYYPVLIIGAGESGIAMGCRLRQVLGFDQFRIVDRHSALGGTWHANQYPGIACDVLALIYSYSFAQNPNWTQPFPSGPEIVRYLYDVCESFGVLDKIQLNTNVTAVRWIEEDEEWEATLAHMAVGAGDLTSAEREALAEEKGADAVCLRTEVVRAKVICSAVGGLVEPKPHVKVPGFESFEGKIMHTARWDSSVDFHDKDVIVVGTGCSAAQVIPQLVTPEIGAKSVTQLMRSPPWAQAVLTKAQKEAWNKWMPILCTYIPGFQNFFRKLMMGMSELDFYKSFRDNEKSQKSRQELQKSLLAHMRKVVPEEFHEILTPNFEVLCKRRVIDEGWFEAFRDPKVSITSLPLTAMGAKSVTLGPGRHYPPMDQTDSKAPTEQKTIPADVIVMANGYETGEWLHPLDVTGKGGRSLYDVWSERGGAQAYLGTAMDGFPNFFLLLGPNTLTGHTSVILASENMVNYSLKFIKPILSGEVTTWEVKEEAERKWTEGVQRDLKKTVFMAGGCTSWYVNRETGWNAVTYPRSQIEISLRYMFPKWSDWDVAYTKKGQLRMRLRRIVLAFATFGTLAGILYGIRVGKVRSRQAIGNVVKGLRGYLREGLDALRTRV